MSPRGGTLFLEGNAIGVSAVDTPDCDDGALCAEEHATSMTKNFFTHPVTRELRNRFLLVEREPEISVVSTKFLVHSGFDRGTDHVELG
jgi:hypothetical protein